MWARIRDRGRAAGATIVACGGAGTMVLIADDDVDIRNVLTEILRMRGYEVAAVCDGEDALAFVQKTKPCVLLLDLMMPGMNGWEVAARMRADRQLAEIPIWIVTATQEPPPLGIRVLRKPLNLPDVLAAVRQCCHCHPSI
jgi:CheY-like chemotaxis protein